MKIEKLHEFIKNPPGTIFECIGSLTSSYDSKGREYCHLGKQDLCCKGESCADVFFYYNILPQFNQDNDQLEWSSVTSRWGDFDPGQLFLVYDREDISRLKCILDNKIFSEKFLKIEKDLLKIDSWNDVETPPDHASCYLCYVYDAEADDIPCYALYHYHPLDGWELNAENIIMYWMPLPRAPQLFMTKYR